MRKQKNDNTEYRGFCPIYEMKKWIKILYVKWILGQCHHLCCMCHYRNQCFDEIEYDDLK